jgi:hypothetical protein
MMCIFVVLCVDETHYFMREYSDAIKLPESYPPPFALPPPPRGGQGLQVK